MLCHRGKHFLLPQGGSQRPAGCQGWDVTLKLGAPGSPRKPDAPTPQAVGL